MKDFWDARYREEEYAFGVEPNVFFREILEDHRPAGSILLPAEGEGRNAVYAAKFGLEVYAFDQSMEGKKKAIRFAEKENVKMDYQVGEFTELPFFNQRFDVAALIYAHFEPGLVSSYHKRMAELLKPNGLLVLEGFSTNHLRKQKENPNVGGPKKESMLFSLKQMKADFSILEPILLEEKMVHLNEGRFHQGEGMVIRFVGRKTSRKVK
ncbi:class I SAM-dependent methyltransferase [Reichenbachiella ulvae]|uniref:Class I SAM-dependent methyltransferase n=1 Tax=Reichenbachiella ulvae TaxID=2980104 RepID=A0ABT3CSA5_9BACT|nr:class I SAM-dependent methyltransferase [Reichenbachiella ulvae]MCV9386585.1 class I SAM-dependent methyltransferase [Reichenbachiella ulvae]